MIDTLLDETAFKGWTHNISLTPDLARGSEVPKYKQLIFAIVADVQDGQIKKDYRSWKVKADWVTGEHGLELLRN